MTRSDLGFVSQEMENAWNEYSRLERDVDWLKSALQGHMNRSDLSQVSAFELQAYINYNSVAFKTCLEDKF